MPASTLSSSPQRVMARNLSGSSVSSETLTRSTPQALSSAAYFASCEPLVVSVSSSSAPVARCRDSERKQRHDAAPHQRLAAGQPQFGHAFRHEGAAQPVELLEAEQVGLGQERHVLRHAIDAAEIAAVGHRDAQIGDGARERIDQRARHRASAVDGGSSVPLLEDVMRFPVRRESHRYAKHRS